VSDIPAVYGGPGCQEGGRDVLSQTLMNCEEPCKDLQVLRFWLY
jgi:hypothetical protein